jgi:uncharacterized protein YndB with AHSA1/START domain
VAEPPAFVRFVEVFDAPREVVFRAWTDPDELMRWWGPGAFTTPAATVDLRPGGRYELVMQPPGGGDPLVVAGEYREVRPPERLVYTWRWEAGVPDPRESLVTVEFRDLGGRTEVVLVHDNFAGPGPLEPYSMGWESGLAKLRSLVT